MQDILKKPCITARQRAWNSMRIFRNFSVGDIEATAEINRANLHTFLRLLVDCGYVGKAVKPGTKRKVYSLLHDTGPRTPRTLLRADDAKKGLFDQNTGEKIWINDDKTISLEMPSKHQGTGTARQRAWSAMRTLRNFTMADIEKKAKIDNRNLQAFIALLLVCGYLEIEGKAVAGGLTLQQEVYILTNDTGAQAPKQVIPTREEKKEFPLRMKGLRDPNTGVIFWPERKARLKEVMQWNG